MQIEVLKYLLNVSSPKQTPQNVFACPHIIFETRSIECWLSSLTVILHFLSTALFISCFKSSQSLFKKRIWNNMFLNSLFLWQRKLNKSGNIDFKHIYHPLFLMLWLTINGKWTGCYIALFYYTWTLKALYKTCLINNLGFSIFPKDTLACRLRHPGIESPCSIYHHPISRSNYGIDRASSWATAYKILSGNLVNKTLSTSFDVTV